MKAGRETSRDYAHPHRPLPVRALNALWGSVGRPWLTPVEAASWVRAAERAEKREATGWDLEPFRRLAESAASEARLNALGQRILHERIVGALRSRLRVDALPESDPTVRAPVFICGLQRTGTTFLHRLIASTPSMRGLRSWEALHPAPFRGETGSDKREKAARQAAGALAYLAPDFLAAHPVEADEPEEEVVVFEQVGLSTGFEATLRVPSYAAWLEDADQGPTYRWLARVLTTLQAGDARRWVLKSPHHLEFLPALLEIFPDARFIWTHRDPRTTVPSFCSMVAHAHGLCSDHVDPHEIGAHWLRKTSRMVERALAFRRERPEVPFLDVRYEELVRDPVATAERVLAFLEEPVDEATRAALTAEKERSRAGRFGKHVYAAEDFGLTAEGIAEAFADYREVTSAARTSGTRAV